MANNNLFKNKTKKSEASNTVDTFLNNAGAPAYELSSKAALAQFACTGTFSNTYYATAEGQLEDIKKYVAKVDPEFLAKLAIYSRQSSFMKDTSAFLLACLMVRDINLFKKVFNRVIDNGKMLRNFVQIVRSGQVGRKSFGSAPKKVIRKWLEDRTDNQLFEDSIGNSPSLKDVIKMVHPKPSNPTREALYAYLIDKPLKEGSVLPELVTSFEVFKKAPKGEREIPKVNFQMLTALDLSDKEWSAIAKNMSWHQLRMNLNTLARHNVFDDKKLVELVATKLKDLNSIRNSKVFPYQLYTTNESIVHDVPQSIKLALNEAMEAAIKNIPKFEGKIVVAVDCSGSMDCPVTGARAVSTTTTCKNVASLIAASMLRNSDSVDVLRFTTTSERIKLNPDNSVFENTKTIGSISGGTAVSSPVRQLNDEKALADLVIIVSDNESWADRAGYYNQEQSGSSLMGEWKKFKDRNPNAKLICIDLAANNHTQAISAKDRLNIGSFSDNVYNVIHSFYKNTNSNDFWIDQINNKDSI
jgi:60 kDa SS-A/Ro ribonucleoprotein